MQSSDSDTPHVRKPLGRPGNSVKIGIVGLPNVGKSSLFNLLSKLHVPAENFPFCTIEPNVAIVPVPDRRFGWLCEKFHPASEVPPVVNITDIAGLVRGAHEGQGLGNAFLSHIRAVDALLHVVRVFEDSEIVHVEDTVDPCRDIQTIHDELLFKDIATVREERDRLEKVVARTNTREKRNEFDALNNILTFMETTRKWIRLGDWTPIEIEVLNQHLLLTAKEVVFLVNLSKRDYLRKGNRWLPQIQKVVTDLGGGTIIPFSVAFEMELSDMATSGTLAEYQTANPEHKSVIPRILKTGYAALDLVHFFTCGTDEVRGWTIRRGRTAPEAAGVIHTDFERGFICAEIMGYEDLKELGSEEAVKKAGKYHQQGKKYIMNDGDIAFFRFNV